MKHLQIALLLSTTFSLTLAACGDDTDFVPGDRDASVADSGDTDASSGNALSVSSSTVVLTEATGDDHTGTITVSVSAPVAADTPLTVSFSETGKVTAAPASISAGDTSVSLSFTASQDADALDEELTATISATGYDSVSVRIEIDDDEVPTPALSATPSTLSLTEAIGADHQGQVTISLTSTKATDTDLTVTMVPEGKLSVSANPRITAGNAGASLTFTALDDADADDETVRVTVSADGYDPVELSVTISDDDTAAPPALSVSPNTLSLTEGGANGTVTVSIPAAVTADTALTVTYSVADKVSAASATIASGSTSVDLTISPEDDADTDNETVTVTIAADGYTSTTVAVTVTDDDTAPAPAIVLDTSGSHTAPPATVVEGNDVSFWLTLDNTPASAVEVTLTSTNTDVSFSPNPVSLNGTAAVEVTATIAADGDTAPDLARITASATGYTPYVYDLAITESAGAAQAFVTSSDFLQVTEGETGTFLVRLTTEPTSDVSATISVDAVTEAPVTVTPTSLTFTTSNWNTARTISVSATADADHIGTDNVRPSNPVTLHVQATGITTADVDVDVRDAQSEIWIGTISSTVAAGGGTATFGLAARETPSGTLTVELSAADQANQPITLSSPHGTPGGALDLSVSLDSTASELITVTGGSSGTAGNVPITITVNGAEEATQTVQFVP